MARIDMVDIVKLYYDRTKLNLRGKEQVVALDHVSLTVADGETVSLVGKSGCGKSTLLRCVAGLEELDGGRVLYDGVDFTGVKPSQRGVGMVFQDYALYPTRSGQGNLSYFFQVRHKTEQEIDERVKATAEILGMGFELLLGRLPNTLSGGEKQRVAIGRCIVRDPSLFLMDEPICNLDAKLRERTRFEVKKLLRRFGVTTLYVTHDKSEATFMGDRIVVMRDGRIEQAGTYDEVYYTPHNLYVAAFFSEPPLCPIEAHLSEDGRSLSVDGCRLDLPDGPRTALAGQSARRILLGFRADSLSLAPDGEGLPFTIERYEEVPTLRAIYAFGTLYGKHATVLVDRPGSTGQARVRPIWERLILFSAEDEKALYHPPVQQMEF
ncbi:MAG: ABC transporter ATP-binding protein [Patescibacteria group bacterium]